MGRFLSFAQSPRNPDPLPFKYENTVKAGDTLEGIPFSAVSVIYLHLFRWI